MTAYSPMCSTIAMEQVKFWIMGILCVFCIDFVEPSNDIKFIT
jgi:hypothetical protein